jgi:hypothetical protein
VTDDEYVCRRLFNPQNVEYDEKRPNVIFHSSVQFMDFRNKSTVELELDQHEIVLVLRYMQFIEGSKQRKINKVIFRASLDQLYRVYIIHPQNSGDLMLSFYDEKL